MKKARRRPTALADLLQIMARLRSPTGCPWDREQDHQSLRFHAVEEVYELLDAIEAKDDHEIIEELGDLLLQVVFHCQLGAERGAFDFEKVARCISDKLIHRHPHVFGDAKVKDVDAVWAQWERLKRAEKEGTRHARPSALDGIPRHLPGLLYAQKLYKKARKAGLAPEPPAPPDLAGRGRSPTKLKKELRHLLFGAACLCHEHGWSAEELLRAETRRMEKSWRATERKKQRSARP